MKRFDCLSPDTVILGSHFLEASAGTGKTFAVEHIVARLLLNEEVPIELEQILVVTFTRAAARELKLRIRSNLQQILERANWQYLKTVSLDPIKDALATFERCQIFTIHGFCHRMLQEFFFEAGICLLQKEDTREPSKKREAALRDFFEFHLTTDIISNEQLEIALKWAGSVEDLARKLKTQEQSETAKFWPERLQEFYSVIAQGPFIEPDKLKEDWESLQKGYKKKEGDLQGQLEALLQAFSKPHDPLSFNRLIEEKGTLFDFISPENKKLKAKDPAFLHYPDFFNWAHLHILPLINSASNPKEIFNALLAAWKPIDRKVLEEEGNFGPDELLLQMQKAVQIPSFRQKIQQKYQAVLIDEFQDTDPVQWNIFERLFLSSTAAMYLIGDPKQSIYRFRKADLYTYLKAKESIPPEGHYYLDTNYRSSKQLIKTLNALFNREWLHLPKEKKTIPYLPVKAGLDLDTNYPDSKGAVHCVLFKHEDNSEIHRYIAREIQNLKKQNIAFNSWAILVKDRYEASQVQQILTIAGIPSSLKSQDPLSKTLAFEAVRELFEALNDPRHIGKAKTVLAGPFGGYSAEKIILLEFSPFENLRKILDERGLPFMLQFFFQMQINNVLVHERISSHGPQFHCDVHQVLEILFEWEKSNGFSFDGVLRFFQSIQQTSSEEAIVQRKEEEDGGVQIMTMHASKGLEFEIVFASGLGEKTYPGDEEANAEKQRLLYVAMTRAKKRLYIPLPEGSRTSQNEAPSPIEMFCKFLSAHDSWESELLHLSKTTSLTIEKIDSSIPIESITIKAQATSPSILKLPPYQSSHLLSFTTLSKQKIDPVQALEPLPEGHLPRGTQTGIIIHQIFERIFTEDNAWKNQAQIRCIVQEELLYSPLQEWSDLVLTIIQSTLDLRLPTGFCLKEIDEGLVRPEVEFLFENTPHYLKGSIDLLFMHQGKVYFVDWKTNWLTEYTEGQMKLAVTHHQYDLQASIYKEAIKRVWKEPFEELFGGAIYLFVRGPAALCFKPERRPL